MPGSPGDPGTGGLPALATVKNVDPHAPEPGTPAPEEGGSAAVRGEDGVTNGGLDPTAPAPRARLLRRTLRPAWSSRNLELILAARVAMSAGRALAGVIVPIYLALQGFSAVELAAYVVVVAAASAVLSTAIGTLADQVGRKPFLVALPLVTAAAAATFAVTASHPLLFVAGALGSFGRGAGAGAGAVGPYQPAESAFVTDDLPSQYRNAAFGFVTFSSSFGALVGSLLALLVPKVHAHGAAATAAFRDGFVAIAVASAVAGILAWWLVEARRLAPRRTGAGGAGGRGDRARRFRLPHHSRWLLYRLWITNTLNGAAVGMFGPFVTYWFFRRFDVGSGQLGLLFAAINAATMVSSLSAAGLARRWGLVRTVTVVRVLQAVLLVPMVLAPSFVAAGAVYFLRMIVQRIGLPLRQSYAVGLAHPDERASVAALSNLPSQLAMAGSPLVTGYLMDEVSLSLPFELAAVLQFLNASTFWLLFRRHPPDEERPRDAGTGQAAPVGDGAGASPPWSAPPAMPDPPIGGAGGTVAPRPGG